MRAKCSANEKFKKKKSRPSSVICGRERVVAWKRKVDERKYVCERDKEEGGGRMTTRVFLWNFSMGEGARIFFCTPLFGSSSSLQKWSPGGCGDVYAFAFHGREEVFHSPKKGGRGEEKTMFFSLFFFFLSSCRGFRG